MLEPANAYFDRQVYFNKKKVIKREDVLKVTREIINSRHCNGTLIGKAMHESHMKELVPDRVVLGYGKYCVVVLNTFT